MKKKISAKQLFQNITFYLAIFTFVNFFVSFENLSYSNTKSTKTILSKNLKDLSGSNFNTKNFDNEGKPIVIIFWATWCKPCLEELNVLADLYDAWKEQTGVKIIAISIDDSRTSKKVVPLVKSKGWEFEIYLDENSDFKRAMGIANPPHCFLLDENKNIVYEHNGFANGDENHLFESIKNCIKVDD